MIVDEAKKPHCFSRIVTKTLSDKDLQYSFSEKYLTSCFSKVIILLSSQTCNCVGAP